MTEAAGRALIFLDASVLIAASGSTTGGSALVVEVCRGTRFSGVCSQQVLIEAQENIRSKLGMEALARFYQIIAGLSLIPTSPDAAAQEADYHDLVGPKDAHVIVAAVNGGVSYLLTLDRKHLVNERVRGASLPFQVLTPGEFIQQILREL
jgi:predicted nucleic acid-binding protein